jgi:hypothetical protein
MKKAKDDHSQQEIEECSFKPDIHGTEKYLSSMEIEG